MIEITVLSYRQEGQLPPSCRLVCPFSTFFSIPIFGTSSLLVIGAQILGNADKGKYVVFVDPLNGSSNIDVDVTIGSIFSIHRRPVGSGDALKKALHLKGKDQVAAGYALYGPSTMLMYTAGNGVHGFTLDPGIGDFFLSHENIRIPSHG